MGKMPARNDGGEESALSPTNGSSARPVIHTHRHNLRNRFHIEKTIGEGTYGKVKLAVEKNTGEQVAIKYIKLTKISNEQDLSRIRREIKIMSTLNHPNIISVREVFENREKIILVMDYAAGGELYDYINTRERLTEKEARKIFRQIVAAIYYSHQHGVVHRDLKLENIVLDGQENVKIADFGLSNYHKPGHLLSTFCGSPLYASPEIVNGIAYKGPEVDCWSLGVLLYTLVYGAMPFDGSDFKRLRKQITMGDYYEPAKSSDAAGLIRQLLTVNRDRRASMEAIVHHWWVNLGYKITPNNEPYPSQWQLKAGTGRDHSSFSSDSDGEIDLLEIKKRGAFRSKATWRRKRIERTFEEDEAVYDVDQETKFLNGRENFLGAVDISENKENSKTISADMKGASEESRQLDSEGKPIRSILKRRSQYIGGDSGCILNDSVAKEMRDTVDGGYEPVFTSQAGDKLIDSKSKTLTDNTVFQKAAGNEFCTEKPYVNSKRGILKRPSQSSDPRKRLSFGSVGSNSSGDILDFSYDSGDGDQFLMKYSAQLKYEGHPDKIQQVKFCQQDLASLHISQSSHGEARSSFQFFDREEASEVHQCALKICHKLC